MSRTDDELIRVLSDDLAQAEAACAQLLTERDAARADLATVREEHAKLTAVVIDLEAQNRLFRAETKSCADCDGVTLAEVTTLRAELEAERRRIAEAVVLEIGDLNINYGKDHPHRLVALVVLDDAEGKGDA